MLYAQRISIDSLVAERGRRHFPAELLEFNPGLF